LTGAAGDHPDRPAGEGHHDHQDSGIVLGVVAACAELAS